jgi:hypothetical protein
MAGFKVTTEDSRITSARPSGAVPESTRGADFAKYDIEEVHS